MKNYLLFLLFSASLMLNAQIDDIESYPEGPLFNNTWTTWNGENDGAQNAIVTTDQANSGTKSIVIENDGQDALYYQGGTANSGTWKAEWSMFVPTGHSGYFNVQGNAERLTQGGDPVFLSNDIYFNRFNANSGELTVIYGDYEFERASFPQDEWFKMAIVVHIDRNNEDDSFYKLYLNDELITPVNLLLPHIWNSNPIEDINGFDAVDFFRSDDYSKFYVDDIVFSEVDILSTSNLEETKFSFFPNPVKDVLHINSKNKITKKLTIYNNLGQIVSENHPNTLSPNINTSSLNSGLYLVNILTNDGNEQILKIMK